MLDVGVQAEIVEWHDREWYDIKTGRPKTLPQIINKLFEEGGELAAAVTKLDEQRTDQDWELEALKELGDVQIVCRVIASRLGHGLGDIERHRWYQVRTRKSSDYRDVPTRNRDATSEALRPPYVEHEANIDGTTIKMGMSATTESIAYVEAMLTKLKDAYQEDARAQD